jgi:hypothetical protein
MAMRGRRAALRIGLAAAQLALAGCASIMPANIGGPPFCAPALAGDDAGSVLWDLANRPSTATSDAPTLYAAGRVFAGTWDVLTVATEGVTPPATARWRLQLVASNPSARDLCRNGRCSSDVGYPAAGAPLQGSTHFDSTLAARGELHGSDAIKIFFNRLTNRVQLMFGEDEPGHGTQYQVTRITDSTFTGRWTDAGVTLAEVHRGDVRTDEHLQGFFCAKRLVAR